MVVEPLIGEGLKGAAIEFIDYARWIISFLIVYYAIRFFTVSTEEEDAKAEREWKERGEQYSEYINKTVQNSKDKDAAKSRHLNIGVAESAILNAMKHAEEALDAKSDAKLRVYKSKITLLHKEIDLALHGLREKRAKFTDPTKFDVNTYIASLQAQRNDVKTKLIDTMPTTDVQLKAVVEKDITDVRTALDTVIKAIQKYLSTP